jgi:hypothetical protein
MDSGSFIFSSFFDIFFIIVLPSLHKNSSVYPNKCGFEAGDLKFNIFSKNVFDIIES